MTIYTRARATADRLLAPAKFGAGTIKLVRKTITPATNSWENPTITTMTEPLKAQAFGVSKELVGLPANEPENGVVLATDKMVIAAVPVMGYRPGDLLAIDGAPVTIISVKNIPGAGTVSAIKFIVRGGAVAVLPFGPWSLEFSGEFG
jgi:hypothetical protein